MTEHEWLASSDPQAMLRAIQGKVSDRRLRLFACACVRQIWHLLDDKRSRHAVEMAERYADGLATQQELAAASSDAAWYAASSDAAKSASRSAASSHQCILLRDIFGNPWKPLAWPSEVKGFDNHWRVNYSTQLIETEYLRDRCIQIQSHWLTPTVKSLAQAAYEERGENGHIDPDRLLILSDALEEAGCDCEEVLRHLRGKIGEPAGCPRCEFTGRLVVPELPRGWQYCPFCADKPNGPHVRGCWVVDLLLGKE